jgi:hypothetical protein
LFRRWRVLTQIITVFTFMVWPINDHDAPRLGTRGRIRCARCTEDQWVSGSATDNRIWHTGQGTSETPLVLVDRSTCMWVPGSSNTAGMLKHQCPSGLIWPKPSVTEARALLEFHWFLHALPVATGLTAPPGPPFCACWRGSFWPSRSQSPCVWSFPCDPTAQSSEHSSCPPPCVISLRKSVISPENSTASGKKNLCRW